MVELMHNFTVAARLFVNYILEAISKLEFKVLV